ncbi:MAG: hypothetical protein FWC85_03470 [Elusimicrobia bacterium]|nr:hypothetical protein [Elusimicrobiota bacterium]
MKKKLFIIASFLLSALFIHAVISWINIYMDFRPPMPAQISHVRSENPLTFPHVRGIHMVNDRSKLQRVLRRNSNFEVDIVYANDELYVARSMDGIGGLTLSGLFYGFDLSQSYIWLDLKYSFPVNKSLSERLKEVLAEANISKHRVLVDAPPQYVRELSDSGFFTAFTPRINRHMTFEQRNEAIRNIEALIKETGVSALEADVHTYNLLRFYFPEMCKVVIFVRPFVAIRTWLVARKVARDPTVRFFVRSEF